MFYGVGDGRLWVTLAAPLHKSYQPPRAYDHSYFNLRFASMGRPWKLTVTAWSIVRLRLLLTATSWRRERRTHYYAGSGAQPVNQRRYRRNDHLQLRAFRRRSASRGILPAHQVFAAVAKRASPSDPALLQINPSESGKSSSPCVDDSFTEAADLSNTFFFGV